MVPRWLRATYYVSLSPLMRLNASRYRVFGLGKINTGAKNRAHLGPGSKRYLPGWINVDANLVTARTDIWADLRFKLPFQDDSLDCIYSHHLIEHLPNLEFHFSEMHRVLKSGGCIRVGGPHGDNAIHAMIEDKHDWFPSWPKDRRSIGGRFENFIFCKGEHLTILTESFLCELAEDAGFVDVCICRPGETAFPELFTDEIFAQEPNQFPVLPRTILIEARKH